MKYLFPFFQWHACKLAQLSDYIAKCMTTIDNIYIIFTCCYILKWEWNYFHTNNMLLKPPRFFLSFLVNRVSFRNCGISPAQWNNFWHILQSLILHCYNNISKPSFQVQFRCVASAICQTKYLKLKSRLKHNQGGKVQGVMSWKICNTNENKLASLDFSDFHHKSCPGTNILNTKKHV